MKFPVSTLPDSLYSASRILNLVEGYNQDYLCTSMIAAAAAAIGNSQRVRIRGTWTLNPAMYMVLVGKPGSGKTAPLHAAFRPISDADTDDIGRVAAARAKMGPNDTPKPLHRPRIVSDTTPEAAIFAHSLNPRGITLMTDEVMGFFNTLNRYGAGQFTEQLLTAWSGEAIKVTRKSNDETFKLESPAFSLVGTTQVDRIKDICTPERMAMGFIDRMLFVYPDSVEPPMWTPDNPALQKDCDEAHTHWHETLMRLMYHPMDLSGNGPFSSKPFIVRDFEEKALMKFMVWWNTNLARTSDCEAISSLCTRFMKSQAVVARLALVIQNLYEASGAIPFTPELTLESLGRAIDLYEYFEDSYCRLEGIVKTGPSDTPEPVDGAAELLKMLDDEFTFADACQKGKILGLTVQNVKYRIRMLEENESIVRVARGRYMVNRYPWTDADTAEASDAAAAATIA